MKWIPGNVEKNQAAVRRMKAIDIDRVYGLTSSRTVSELIKVSVYRSEIAYLGNEKASTRMRILRVASHEKELVTALTLLISESRKGSGNRRVHSRMSGSVGCHGVDASNQKSASSRLAANILRHLHHEY